MEVELHWKPAGQVLQVLYPVMSWKVPLHGVGILEPDGHLLPAGQITDFGALLPEGQ